MPISCKASVGRACSRSVAAARLSAGTSVSRCTTAFRKAASTCGALPERTRQASSPSVTSRTECRQFSIRQWSRTNPSRRAASAAPGGRLVIPYATSTVVWPAAVRSRVISNPCAKPGQRSWTVSSVVVRRVRRSTRPCPFSVVLAWRSGGGGASGGKGRRERTLAGLVAEPGRDVGPQPGLVLLGQQHVVAAGIDHLPRQVALAEQRVANHDLAAQRDQAQQL